MMRKSGERSGGGGGAGKREENWCEKFRRRAYLVRRSSSGVVVGPWTPHSSWKLYHHHHRRRFASPPSPPAVSARKLASALWELQHHHRFTPPSHSSMRRASDTANGGRHHHRHHNLFKDKGGLDFSHLLPDPCPSSDPDQPDSASSLRRHIAQSLMQHHRAIERGSRALQPVSPASYGSSMEMAPYNPAVTPSSSLDYRGRVGEPHYSLKTSTELLKVLNRIWSLEEQHAANISMIKALKTELDHARLRIKEMLRDQQADRREMDDLMKQVTEDKLVRKSKEQDRIHAAIQSIRDELEDERKLRRRSESIHRKLARELSEAKSSFSIAAKDLERERNSRKLLEGLCDEYAKGIKSYAQEVHSLKQKSDKGWNGNDHDRLILHISESWLDERMQMKLEEAQSGANEKNSVVDKLSFEIETFLQAKRMGISKPADFAVPHHVRRSSIESVHVNETVSAPRDIADDEDSAGSDSNCFELNKPSTEELKLYANETAKAHTDEIAKLNPTYEKVASCEKPRSRSPANLQHKFEEKMARAVSNGNKKSQAGREQHVIDAGKLVETNISPNHEKHEIEQDGDSERQKIVEGVHGINANHVMDDLIRNHIALSEENDPAEAPSGFSVRRNQSSPIRRWMTKLTTPDIDVSESSSKQRPGVKDHTLKSKLLEARSKGPRSRLKVFKGKS